MEEKGFELIPASCQMEDNKASSETQGQLVGAGKKSKTGENLREEKSRTGRRALLPVLDFSSREFFLARFRLFPAPTNCPCVSEDDNKAFPMWRWVCVFFFSRRYPVPLTVFLEKSANR